MKYLLITIILFASSFEAKAQEAADCSLVTTTTCMTMDKTSQKKLYKQTPQWRKYKTLKAIGWSMFGVGIAGTVVCTYGNAFDAFTNANYNKGNKKTWSVLTGVGVGLTACSIPVLTFAYINRAAAKKSVRLSPACSSIIVDTPTGNKEVVPALGVCLDF